MTMEERSETSKVRRKKLSFADFEVKERGLWAKEYSIWKRPGNRLQNGMQPCWYLGPLKPVLGSDPLSCKIMHLHCFTYKTVVICNSSNSKGIHRVTYLILMRMDFLLAFTFLIHLWNKWIQLCKRNLCINFIALFEDYWENICKPLEQCTL